MRALSTCQLTYFPLWAKGPAPALALAHSGLQWSGSFPSDWPSQKQSTAWSKLPLLTIPSGWMGHPRSLNCPAMEIGHEVAILSYIGKMVPSMGGSSDADWVASTQLMCECEDVYAKLTKWQPTTRQPIKCDAADLSALWTMDADPTTHNRDQGLHCNLGNLDALGARCSASPSVAAGCFTETGVSVGECKLFSTLHALVLIEPEVLRPHPHLAAFHERFGDHESTRSIVEGGGEMPGTFEQYFVRGEQQ